MVVALLFIATSLLLIILILLRYLYFNKLVIGELNEKAILVTGSSAGFGRAFVLKCLDNDLTVFAGCRTKKGAEQLETDGATRKGQLYPFEMDVTSDESVQKAKSFVESELIRIGKRLHAVVNNAGVQCQCFFDDMLTLEDYIDAMEVNAYGVIRVVHAFKDIIKRNRGRIVTCTSSSIRFPSPGMGPYTLSKWAINGYMEVIRHELKDFGVDVITIEPGIYRTPMNDASKMMQSFNAIWAKTDEILKKDYGEFWFSSGKRLYIKIREGAPDDLSPVADSYYHAVTALYPYKNYSVGKDSFFVYRPFSYLPAYGQEIFMQFLRWMYGVPKPDIVD